MDSDDQHDGGHRSRAMTTNLSESFNGFLKSARNLPITALVKLTNYHCVAYFADRYTKALAEVILKMRSIHYQKICGPWIVMTNMMVDIVIGQ